MANSESANDKMTQVENDSSTILKNDTIYAKSTNDNLVRGKWGNTNVALEKLNVDVKSLYSKTFIVDLRLAKDCNHENVIKILGVVKNSPDLLLMTETTERGRLKELLEKEDIGLGWDIAISFIVDIAYGMKYLHQSAMKNHGNLTSFNCLVDNRWTCKVSGFGLAGFRKRADSHDYRNFLWKAPEILRDRDKVGLLFPQSADMYSFGIICQEIIFRKPPYMIDDEAFTPEHIVNKVKEKH